MRRVRNSPIGAVAVLAALISLLPAAPAPGDDTRTVSFVVIDDVSGLAVTRPYVLSWVMGGATLVVHQSRGGVDGTVTVGVPDDASASERIATGLPVNVMTLVTDRMPGSSGLKATAVAAAFNVSGIAEMPFDVAGVDGEVFTVLPGLVDFDSIPLLGSGSSPPPDEPDCQLVDGPCHVIDWPRWVNDIEVPVADNLGGGVDMVATMEYESTTRTTTSVAIGAGRSGFFEARGAATYVKESSLGFGWGEIGPIDNVLASAVSTFQRERAGVCWIDWITGTGRHCALTTTYAPYEAVGPETEPWPASNDAPLDPALDCKRKIKDHWIAGKGTETGKAFTLSLGPGEDWATSVPFSQSHFLHASSQVTSETSTGKSFVRRWDIVDDPRYEYQWVVVKNGYSAYNRLVAGGGAGCPENTVQDVYTYATNEDLGGPQEKVGETQPHTGVHPCDPAPGPAVAMGEAVLPQVDGTTEQPCW